VETHVLFFERMIESLFDRVATRFKRFEISSCFESEQER